MGLYSGPARPAGQLTRRSSPQQVGAGRSTSLLIGRLLWVCPISPFKEPGKVRGNLIISAFCHWLPSLSCPMLYFSYQCFLDYFTNKLPTSKYFSWHPPLPLGNSNQRLKPAIPKWIRIWILQSKYLGSKLCVHQSNCMIWGNKFIFAVFCFSLLICCGYHMKQCM